MKRLSAASLILTLLLLLLSFGQAVAIEKGELAPDFELKTLEGQKVRLSDYKGRIILLKLGTTWCPTCRQQTQEIQDAAKLLAEKNAIVVEVFLQDSEKMVREYFDHEKIESPYVALMDDGSALKAYNVYLIPRVLLIDGDFKVRRDGSLWPSRDLKEQLEKIGGKG